MNPTRQQSPTPDCRKPLWCLNEVKMSPKFIEKVRPHSCGEHLEAYAMEASSSRCLIDVFLRRSLMVMKM